MECPIAGKTYRLPVFKKGSRGEAGEHNESTQEGSHGKQKMKAVKGGGFKEKASVSSDSSGSDSSSSSAHGDLKSDEESENAE